MILFLILMLAFVYVMGVVLCSIYAAEGIVYEDRHKYRFQNAFFIATWPVSMALALIVGFAAIGWLNYRRWRCVRLQKEEDRRRDHIQRDRT
jgi:hypothetical protein